MAAVHDRRRVRPARDRFLRQRVRTGVDRLARRLRPSLRGGRSPVAAADAVLRRELGRLPAVEDHVRRAADRGDGVGGDHGQHPQHADDRVHARLPALHQLAADADRVRGLSARRFRAAQDQPPAEARQRARAGAHGGPDARAGGSDRRASRRQGLRRRALREQAVCARRPTGCASRRPSRPPRRRWARRSTRSSFRSPSA